MGTFSFWVQVTDRRGIAVKRQPYWIYVGDGKSVQVDAPPVPGLVQPTSDRADSQGQQPAVAKAEQSTPTTIDVPSPPLATTTATKSAATQPQSANSISPSAIHCQATGDTSNPSLVLGTVDFDSTTQSHVANDAVQVTIKGSKAGTLVVCTTDNKGSYTTLFTQDWDGKNANPPVQLVVNDKALATLTAGDQLVMQWTSAGAYGPPSAPITVTDCDIDKVASNSPPQGLALSGSTVSGTVVAGETGNVRACLNGVQAGDLSPIAVPSNSSQPGTFSVDLKKTPKIGDLVTVQVAGPDSTFGPPIAMGVGACSLVNATKPDKVTVSTLLLDNVQVIDGTVPIGKDGHPVFSKVRVCVDQTPQPGKSGDQEVARVAVDASGVFHVPLTTPLMGGQAVWVQGLNEQVNATAVYGDAVEVGPVKWMFSDSFLSAVAGVEQAGYSSESLTSNAFASGLFRSQYFHFPPVKFLPPLKGQLALWGKVRFLSTPQPAAPNIVGNIANPSGAITTTNLAGIGSGLDYVFGPEWRIHQWDQPGKETTRASFVVGIGETTPISAADTTFFKMPDFGTEDCLNLQAQVGREPSSVTAVAVPGTANSGCLVNPQQNNAKYNMLAYEEVKRRRFLFKWGVGLRWAQVFVPDTAGGKPYAGMVDVTLGQDESISGGVARGVVFRTDGQYPLHFASLPFIYVFGSSAVRISEHSNETLINLTQITTSPPPAVPSANLLVLPTQYPDKDFWRFGIGFNLVDAIKLFLKPSSGSGGSSASTAKAPTGN